MNNHPTKGAESPRPKHKFITFPLHALAYGVNPLDRVTVILQWFIIDLGPRALRAANTKKPERLYGLDGQGFGVRGLVEEPGTNDDYQIAVEMLLPDLAQDPRFTVAKCREGHDRLEQFIREQEQLCRTPGRKPNFVPHLQLRWLLNCFDQLNGYKPEMPMPYDRFAILCAIYSKIGIRKHDQPNGTGGRGVCGNEEIQRRALGYLTPQDMERCLPHRADGAAPLTRHQIDRRVDHLSFDKFFARYTPRNGRKHLCRWFGRYGMKDSELAAIAEAARGDTSRTFKDHKKRMRQRTDELARQHAPLRISSP